MGGGGASEECIVSLNLPPKIVASEEGADATSTVRLPDDGYSGRLVSLLLCPLLHLGHYVKRYRPPWLIRSQFNVLSCTDGKRTVFCPFSRLC